MPGEIPSLSVIVVAYRQGEAIVPALAAVDEQLDAADELIVVDNASGDATPDAIAAAAPTARLIRNPVNAGFPAACNSASREATGDLLVFLNPDAIVAPGWRDQIAKPYVDGRSWTAWQALVTTEEGTIVNTRGGVVHFTGIAWAGGAGEPLLDDEADRPVGFASGACLAIRRADFTRAGGFASEFFLYHEDVDLSLRLRLAGGEVGVSAGARVDHDYQFDKGQAKWRYLERNRWATLIRVYPAAVLALVVPALLATELALVGASIAGGWFGQKLRAWGDTLRALPRLLGERRQVQATRTISAADFARPLVPGLSTPYLGGVSRSGLLAAILSGYWRFVLRLLRA
ncbi:MAG: glycosyltransferase family 2 protein [Actinomycetota bacterium]|nr:glycosyltransferase family 2 protein [Actinomycetota bacterium]